MIMVPLNALTKIGWTILLDNLINAICILFMSSFYDKWYSILCCCCYKALDRAEKTISNIKNEISSNNNSTNRNTTNSFSIDSVNTNTLSPNSEKSSYLNHYAKSSISMEKQIKLQQKQKHDIMQTVKEEKSQKNISNDYDDNDNSEEEVP